MKAPDLSLGMTLGRAAAELAIIVAGVLIALGAQSWWEDRALDEERRAVLELIRTDLEQLDRALEERTLNLDSIRGSIEWFLDRDLELDSASSSIFANHLRLAFWEAGTVSANFPAYEDLKGSGRLSLLSPELRRTLTELEGGLVRLRQGTDDIFQNQITKVDPWLIRSVPLRGVLEFGPEDGSTGMEELPSAGLLQSMEVQNLLLTKYQLLLNLDRTIGSLRERIEEAIVQADGVR